MVHCGPLVDRGATALGMGSTARQAPSPVEDGRECPYGPTPRPRLALHGKNAVDGDRRAGHEIRGRARQKNRDPGEIRRITPAARGRTGGHALVQAGHLASGVPRRSVSIQPGSTALTWMFSFAQAVAQARVSCMIPPLLAA
jgi:hypothetical protein